MERASTLSAEQFALEGVMAFGSSVGSARLFRPLSDEGFCVLKLLMGDDGFVMVRYEKLISFPLVLMRLVLVIVVVLLKKHIPGVERIVRDCLDCRSDPLFPFGGGNMAIIKDAGDIGSTETSKGEGEDFTNHLSFAFHDFYATGSLGVPKRHAGLVVSAGLKTVPDAKFDIPRYAGGLKSAKTAE